MRDWVLYSMKIPPEREHEKKHPFLDAFDHFYTVFLDYVSILKETQVYKIFWILT